MILVRYSLIVCEKTDRMNATMQSHFRFKIFGDCSRLKLNQTQKGVIYTICGNLEKRLSAKVAGMIENVVIVRTAYSL